MRDFWWMGRQAMIVGALVCAGGVLVGVLGGQSASAPATAPQGRSGKGVVWVLDDVKKVDGVATEVLGAPEVVTEEGGEGKKAIHFDGVKDGMILPVVPIAGMKAFTIECLFKPESGGPAETRFMHSEDEHGNRFTLETRLTPEGWALDTFLLSGQDRLTLLDVKKLHPADRWYWVALRFDGSTMTSFINGVKELEGPVKFAGMEAKGRISRGVRLNKVSWFKGMIREVRVTPEALGESALHRVR